jgi:hypothetical protein
MKTAYDQLDVALDRDTSRRQVTQGLGALVLGALGALVLRQPAAAKTCKQKCKDNNCGRLSPRKCNRRCTQRCKDKND